MAELRSRRNAVAEQNSDAKVPVLKHGHADIDKYVQAVRPPHSHVSLFYVVVVMISPVLKHGSSLRRFDEGHGPYVVEPRIAVCVDTLVSMFSSSVFFLLPLRHGCSIVRLSSNRLDHA